MGSKISVFLILSLAVSLSCAVPVRGEGDLAVTDTKWLENECALTYNLSQDGMVKIRVGSFAGPVYRTIVNLEKRAKGQNRDKWDGKDEAGKIDFLKYGKPHFCVGVPIQQDRDTLLKVRINTGADTLPDKLTVDVDEGMRPLFLKYGGELRIYVDNKLKKIERVAALPFTLSLDMADVSAGTHFMTINLWQAAYFSVLAYSSSEILIPARAGSPGVSQEAGSLTGIIAFSKQDAQGFWQIFTSRFDGKDVRQLTSTLMDKRYAAWSPDGKEIAYVNGLGELWIMGKDGNKSRKIDLPMRASEPRFSPDGKNMIFTGLEDVYHGNTKIWQINLANSQLTKLVNRPWLQYNPNYSPDGTQIIFTDGPELFGQDIRKLDLKTGDITQLTDNGSYDYDMQAVFLNSGEEIVYSSNQGGGDYKIYKMDKFGRDKIRLSPSVDTCDTMPAVSKSGGKIFFLSGKNGRIGIWQMSMDGRDAKQITRNGDDINSFAIYGG